VAIAEGVKSLSKKVSLLFVLLCFFGSTACNEDGIFSRKVIWNDYVEDSKLSQIFTHSRSTLSKNMSKESGGDLVFMTLYPMFGK